MEPISTNKLTGGGIERLYINVVRGTAIFLMIWGHCVQFCAADSFDFFENTVFKIIYSFHMPLFVLVSGYLFFFSLKKRDLESLLIHRTQSLLQPIIMCGIFYFLLTDVLLGLLLKNVRWTVLLDGKWISHFNDFWFLWSVLAASIVVAISCKITEKLWLQLILLIFGIAFVAVFPNWQMNIYVYPYFVIGFLFAKYKTVAWIKKLKYFKYVSIPLFPIMMLFYEKNITYTLQDYKVKTVCCAICRSICLDGR